MIRPLDTLLEAARTPWSEWGSAYPGYVPMGYLCSYVPEELIHAAGFAPVRLRGAPAPIRRAEAHMQSFTCALCRSTLDQELSGNLASLAGVVFAHTCDTMQALADVWRMNSPGSFVETVMQPVNLGAPAARAYLIAELACFRERLEELVGHPIDDERLRTGIALCDETRTLVQALQQRRESVPAPHFFAVLTAAQRMPRQVLHPLLAALLAKVPEPPRRTGPRLFLTGPVLDEPRVLDLIHDLGATVAGDDLCSGSRHFDGLVGSGGDPITNLADHSLRRPPCPSKYHPAHDPGDYLLDRVREAQADGVVWVLAKFCEPHAFDFARVRPVLEQAGVPSLLLEMEQVPSLEGLRTRLQAFVEML
jgi:bzd-type benzoyl-CoA reductase N subunit